LSREDLSPIRDIYGVLRRFAAFCGVLRRFAAPQQSLAIDSVAGPNIWGGSNPRPLFWSVENNRAKMGGGNGPLSPLKTFSLASSSLDCATRSHRAYPLIMSMWSCVW